MISYYIYIGNGSTHYEVLTYYIMFNVGHHTLSAFGFCMTRLDIGMVE